MKLHQQTDPTGAGGDHLRLADVNAPASPLQRVWDAIGVPFRFVLFPDDWQRKFGWTSLEQERIRAVMPHLKGRLLDVGAGPNTLVHLYPGEGVGVDVYDFGGGAMIVEDTRRL